MIYIGVSILEHVGMTDLSLLTWIAAAFLFLTAGALPFLPDMVIRYAGLQAQELYR